MNASDHICLLFLSPFFTRQGEQGIITVHT